MSRRGIADLTAEARHRPRLAPPREATRRGRANIYTLRGGSDFVSHWGEASSGGGRTEGAVGERGEGKGDGAEVTRGGGVPPD